ncbi:hypothetical protein SAMD00019534_008370 [Acytostelium subglobosum LB1]|uniref:hypothetical protein n=1 Tax=Acytostelium subglobosum LB1 TaxID=1410327 RepID=UPI000644AEB3|nr:hypothetical protein SAMD00019534_008370 [Acytostelium subglobosum LB1]GAM17662.1 hypothetical protein SAMD00019534_008370 [Acytostelium subglobosum LB1]|eukprot:XP_012758258.1 hypothetical protein SAMD00019534_008370 [Acytostelium subglobosum LB1]
MSKIIKQQLSILNRDKDTDDNDKRVNKVYKSPLDIIREKKVDENEVLAANLALLRKKMTIKQKSKAAEKKRDIIDKAVKWTDQRAKQQKVTLKEKKAKKLKSTKKESQMLSDLMR